MEHFSSIRFNYNNLESGHCVCCHLPVKTLFIETLLAVLKQCDVVWGSSKWGQSIVLVRLSSILHLHMSFITDCLFSQFISVATLYTIPGVCVSFIVSASSCCVHHILRTVYCCCRFRYFCKLSSSGLLYLVLVHMIYAVCSHVWHETALLPLVTLWMLRKQVVWLLLPVLQRHLLSP